MGCVDSKPSARAPPHAAGAYAEPAARSAPRSAAALAPIHADIVNCVAPGPWASGCLSCAEDKTLVLHDASSHAVVQRWVGHARGVNRVFALRPGAQLEPPSASGEAGGEAAVASASRDCTLKLWALGRAEPMRTLAGHGLPVTAACALAAGAHVASGSRDYSVRLWDVATGAQLWTSEVSRNLPTFLEPLGAAEPGLFAQGSEDLSIRTWDARLGAVVSTFEMSARHFALCGAAHGHYLLAGCNGFARGAGCEMLLLDRRTNRLAGVARAHDFAVTAVCALSSLERNGGLAAASASKDGGVAVVDFLAGAGAEDATVLATWQPHALGAGVQLTALAALERVGGGAAGGGASAGLMVGTARGSVHTLSLDRTSGALAELCFTQPTADDD
jgi:hypothetical protein